MAVGVSAGFVEPLEASALVLIEKSAEFISNNLPALRDPRIVGHVLALPGIGLADTDVVYVARLRVAQLGAKRRTSTKSI